MNKIRLARLTKEQKDEIFEVATDIVREDISNNDEYLTSIIECYLKHLTMKQQLNAISNDPDLWADMLSFDPFTGNKI